MESTESEFHCGNVLVVSIVSISAPLFNLIAFSGEEMLWTLVVNPAEKIKVSPWESWIFYPGNQASSELIRILTQVEGRVVRMEMKQRNSPSTFRRRECNQGVYS